MKKINQIYSNLYSWENLYFAAQEAGRGKKDNPKVNDFFLDLEKNLLDLQKELQTKTYRHRKYQQFTIYDPKKRLISASHFRDSVVHHAVCRILEPKFEKFFIYHSYACRKNKGIHKALKLAKKYAQNYPYFLKMDIAKFYDSIEHNILKIKLASCIQDEDMLWLLEQIIDSIHNDNNMGIPIGNLTSQYFANYFLSWIDHYAKESLRIKCYLRYMDDFLMFAEEKEDLILIKNSLEQYLFKELRLKWKDAATILAPVTEGIPYLGVKIFPTHTKILSKNWKRFKRNFKNREYLYQQSKISISELQMSVGSMIEFLKNADTFYIREHFFSKYLSDF